MCGWSHHQEDLLEPHNGEKFLPAIANFLVEFSLDAVFLGRHLLAESHFARFSDSAAVPEDSGY